MMKNILITGLGNPGSQYEQTKHNIGQQLFEHFEFTEKLQWREKYKGLYASLDFDDLRVHFLKPMTYMNLSGESVAPLANFFKIDLQDILVVHDELDLEFGVVTFKNGGGLAGHNGLKSIASSLGSQNFLRFRMGIGRPAIGSVSAWVLSGYPPDHAMFLEDYLQAAARAVELYIKRGFQRAASQYSKKNLIEKKE